MARPRRADESRSWLQRIRAAKKRHEEWSGQFRVAMGRAYFAGKQNPGNAQAEWITVNKIWSHMQAQLPMLYSVDPYFYVKLKKSFNPDPALIAQYDVKAKIRQANLNYLKEELKLKEKARLSIQDAHFAYGVMKAHYKADEVKNPDKGKAILGENEKPLMGDDGAELMEPDYIPVNERYVLTRVHPDDFIFDVDASSLDDKWSFVAERIRLTKEEARKDRRLNKKRIDELATTTKKREDDEEKDGEEVYVCWEVYDIKNKQWLIVADDKGDGEERDSGVEDSYVMKPTPLPKGVEGHPYSILRFTLQDDSPYPIPPVSQTLDPQREYNQARSKVQVHRKRFNRKYEVVVDMLESEDEVSKLESGDDGTVIKAKVRGAVDAIKDAPLDPQLYSEIGLLNNDLTELFGTPGTARGIADAESATEASILDKRLEVREGDRVSLVVDWLKDIARKLDQLVQAHITRDEAVRINGPEGEFWQIVRAADYEAIEGEFEYSINVGSTQPRLPEIERAQWLAFLQVLASFPHLMTSKTLMKQMAEMHHIENTALIDELFALGQKIMSGQMPMPGQSGAQAGQQTNNPIAAILGSALGQQGGVVNQGTVQ